MYDGIQRPLEKIMEKVHGNNLPRGVEVPPIDPEKLWEFTGLGHGEEGIHDPLPGGQGLDGGILVLVGAADTHRPLLAHSQLHLGAVLLHQDGHGVAPAPP